MQSTQSTIKVNQSEEFRARAAQSILRELLHEVPGTYFVDLEWKIYFREHNALWNPWGDTFVIPLTDLAPGAIGESSDGINDWDAALFSYNLTLNDIIDDFRAEAEFESDEPTEDEVIEWARVSDKYASIIDECEDEARSLAIDFIIEEILDEVEIEG